MRELHDPLEVQLVAVDHECLFGVVSYSYERAVKGHDRAIFHRAVLSLGYRADSDEVNRLRRLQRRLRELDTETETQAALERLIDEEHGRDRSASALAKMQLREIRDAGVRWSVVGKRGAPMRISPELCGLLQQLDPEAHAEDGFPSHLEGTEDPIDPLGEAFFPRTAFRRELVYRPPESVVDVYKALSFVDRARLDAAIDAVVGEGPDAEETATWLEADFEALTGRYELAAGRRLGLHYRFG